MSWILSKISVYIHRAENIIEIRFYANVMHFKQHKLIVNKLPGSYKIADNTHNKTHQNQDTRSKHLLMDCRYGHKFCAH